jgi:hypothetical protein
VLAQSFANRLPRESEEKCASDPLPGCEHIAASSSRQLRTSSYSGRVSFCSERLPGLRSFLGPGLCVGEGYVWRWAYYYAPWDDRGSLSLGDPSMTDNTAAPLSHRPEDFGLCRYYY